MNFSKKFLEERIVVETERGFLIKVLKAEVDHDICQSTTSLKVQYLPRQNNGRGRGNGRRRHRRNLAPRFQQAAGIAGSSQFFEAQDLCFTDYDQWNIVHRMNNMCIEAHANYYDAHGGYGNMLRANKVIHTSRIVTYKTGRETIVESGHSVLIKDRNNTNLFSGQTLVVRDDQAAQAGQTRAVASNVYVKWTTR